MIGEQFTAGEVIKEILEYERTHRLLTAEQVLEGLK